jgi:hypothetical protein
MDAISICQRRSAKLRNIGFQFPNPSCRYRRDFVEFAFFGFGYLHIASYLLLTWIPLAGRIPFLCHSSTIQKRR